MNTCNVGDVASTCVVSLALTPCAAATARLVSASVFDSGIDASITLAMPKSTTLIVVAPGVSTRNRFAGLTSR